LSVGPPTRSGWRNAPWDYENPCHAEGCVEIRVMAKTYGDIHIQILSIASLKLDQFQMIAETKGRERLETSILSVREKFVLERLDEIE